MFDRLSLLLLLAACGAPESGAYVGALSGTDARAAAVIEDDAILLYVCGGPSSLQRTQWLAGSLAGDRIELARGERTFAGWIEDGKIEGVFDDGSELVLSANRVGLYESREGECRTGVIAEESRIQGVSCNGEGSFEQVSPDGPVAKDGFMVRAGARSLFVVPARPE